MSSLQDRMNDADSEPSTTVPIPADGIYTIPPDDEELVEDYDLDES